MAQGYYGSFSIEDLFQNKLAKGSNGKTYVCIDDLKDSPFTVGKNGKHYVNIGVWVNNEPDQYGQIAGISLTQSQAEREAGQKKIYIGNLKQSGAKAVTPSPQAAPSASPAPVGDLPF